MSLFTINDGVTVAGKVQSAEGTASNPAVGTDDMYFEQFDVEPDITLIERLGLSPYSPGFKSARGASVMRGSYRTELKFPTLTASPALGDIDQHPTLYAAGWKGTATNGGGAGTDSIIYVLNARPKQFTHFRKYVYNDTNDAGWRFDCLDTVMTSVLEWSAADRFMISGDLLAQGFKATGAASDRMADSGARGAPVLSTDDPIVVKGAAVSIWDVDSGVMYGGGSVGSPTQTGLQCFSFKFDPRAELDVDLGSGSNSGVARVRNRLRARPLLNLGLELDDLANWFPWDLINSGAHIVVSVEIPDPNQSGMICQFLMHGQATAAPMGEFGGVRSIDFTLEGLYPSTADGSTVVAGSKPSQVFAAEATIPGLFSGAPTLTDIGPAVLAFWMPE